MLQKIETLQREGKISLEVCKNLERWIHLGRDIEAIEQLLKNDLEELQECFSGTIPFGTGGRRGKMGPGPNRINTHTLMDSAQGVVNYLRKVKPQEKISVVITCDTRHFSQDFAEKVAQVFAGNGAKVFLYPSFRSTPQLSFSVRNLQTSVGIMISASHNPPSDNGIKVYWSDGAQVVAPHDGLIIQEVEEVEKVELVDLDLALQEGQIVHVGEDEDLAYLEMLCSVSIYPEREVRIIFSPLHGVGLTNGFEGLKKAGFSEIYKVESQCQSDGDFPEVENHIPNPEVPSAMKEALKLGEEKNGDIALVTDPDADRLGVGVATKEGWHLLTGNEIGALILYHLLQSKKNSLPQGGVVIETLPTSGLIGTIGRSFSVKVLDHLLVGFKYIAYEIENFSEDQTFLFGCEESHGYLLDSRVRDKDGAMAALAIAQIASHLKKDGLTLLDGLKEIYREFGYYKNILQSLAMAGLAGKEKIKYLMDGLRQSPPTEMGSLLVTEIHDYKTMKKTNISTGETKKIDYPFSGNMLVFHLQIPGEDLNCRFILRPSGTEPKIKGYFEVKSPVPPGDFRAFQKSVDQKATALLDEIMSFLKEKMG